MIKFILDLPRWAFFALLIITPWAWGGIPIFVEVRWYKFALGIAIAYFISALLRRNFSWPPLVPSLAALYILVQGWWMVYNACFQPLPQFKTILSLPSHYPAWPGSFDRSKSILLMWKVTDLLALSYLAYDLSQAKIWRKRLLLTLLVAGGSIATFGMIMRIESPYGIWPDLDRNNYPFATFYYHGNAAAYLNTILPIALALFLRGLFTETTPITMAIQVCAFLVVGAAAFVCASKAGMVIALILILVLLVFFYVLFWGRFDQMTFELPPFFLWILVVSVVVTMIVCIGQQSIMKRWDYVLEAGNAVMAGRQATAEICYRAIPEAGWFGFGPGTFATIFPFAVIEQHATSHGLWRDAHEDYLQTVLEWGKAGAIAWSVFFFGSIMRIFFSRRFWGGARRYDRILLAGLMLSLLGCAAHSLVDYPLQITAIQLNVLVVVGLLWASPHWEIKERTRRSHRSGSRKGLNQDAG